MLKVLLLLFGVLSILLAEPSISRTQVHMATFVSITLPKSKQNLFKPVFEIVKNMDETFSSYKTEAQTFRLNQKKKLKVSDDFIKLLKLSKALYIQTQGYFSIAIGSITKDLYHFGQTNAHIPTKEKLLQAKSEALGFFIKEQEVSLDEKVSIDFGGIAKGYTVDKIKHFLQKHKVKKFQIALSGDIYCEGKCKIAIRSPFEKDKLIEVLDLENEAISTSGNYERYIKSKKHNHLINPKKRVSQKNIASITLYSKHHTNTTLDALATALSVMPQQIRMKILKNHPKISYMFITTDKKRHHYEYKKKETP
ncbi:FAD:protein FMN transferase [Sulfurimonas sp. MAG313]|nr:FAD:protein FMN transferase [Sulfurimonas sp. MAG313]MDF1880017.1 FAD:protein FMN transferase [Sulfurimonas sp. MAG313]